MKTSFEGIVSSGGLQLDESVDLADQCRVHVTVIPINECPQKWAESLSNLEELRSSEPIRSGGLRYSREQLNERD
ncbi:hypothetical protein [Adhaeretor mobilis]|uniref:Uncharacterized protein n=1 Tax=Adhaeretor mobilis TaxID=1930276 RepID=A0A517N235_9BACT|nr:hypothetical protein [Adhaeretor mobilis]QDT01197.1 hypothetical protein HG15A2_45390 [Adhaeretor mobilis]